MIKMETDLLIITFGFLTLSFQQAYLAEMEAEGQFSVSQREQSSKAAVLMENQQDIKVPW